MCFGDMPCSLLPKIILHETETMYFFLIIFVLRLYVATADRTQHSAVPWFSILQRRGANKRAWLSSRLDHVS